ncbi:MAG TPA: ATP-binding protein [Stenomitos sp.]
MVTVGRRDQEFPWYEAWLGVDSPAERGHALPWQSYGWSLISVVVCTLVDQMLFGRMAESNLIMIYLLGILPVALRGNGGAAFFTAVLSVAAFDFFFVHPYLTFAVSDTQYLLTFFIMGMVGMLISALTARLASQLSAIRQRERRAKALYELSRSLLSARAPMAILSDGARVIASELGQPVGAWLKGPHGEPFLAATPAIPLNASEEEVLRWVLREGRSAGPGTGMLPGSAYLFMPVTGARTVYGALALRWSEEDAFPGAEVRSTLQTSVNQLAIAMDEARAREEADKALRQAEAERLRSALLSSVSHDLRTPLTGIVGAASSLVDGAEALTPEVRRDLAQGIVEEANRLSRLVNNLLQATRLDSGAVQLARTWFPIEEAIAPALARLSSELSLHPVQVDLPRDLPMIDGDPLLVEQVFANLLDNAAKYSPPGTSIRVKAWPDGGWLWVEVSDRGPGIPPGEEERIFEKFRRYPARSGAAGAGLGLAICRGIVQAHGGTMRARNLPEGGSAFQFYLPIANADATSKRMNP